MVWAVSERNRSETERSLWPLDKNPLRAPTIFSTLRSPLRSHALLPAGGAFGEAEASLVMAVHKAALCSWTLLHARWNENFLKTVDILQRYSDIKTPVQAVQRFNFKTCSAHVYSTKSKPFGKSIWDGQFWYCGEPPQINQCMGNIAFHSTTTWAQLQSTHHLMHL